MKAPHRTSRVYSAALAELRARHAEEFEQIYAAELDAAGVLTIEEARRIRQQSILDFIDTYWRDNGEGPSRPAITYGVGVKESTLSTDLADLASRGLVVLPGPGKIPRSKRLRTTRLAESD